MLKTIPFEIHTEEYEEWFEKYKYAYESEIAAIQEQLPALGLGIEIGVGTGRYAVPLGIKEGIEPSDKLRSIATQRGIEVMNAYAEKLPYKDMRFDFVLMVFCISYFDDINAAMKEAYRVLKRNGSLVIGFIDKNSLIGKQYEQRKSKSIFYKYVVFFPVDKVISVLKNAGFKDLTFNQTLFHDLDKIKEIEQAKEGYGEGSFVVIKAIK